MKIAIDFDCVLANTIKRWIEIFNDSYSEKYDNLQLAYNKITQWGFYSNFDITKKDAMEIFSKCWKQYESLEPTELMLHYKISKLSKLSDALDIVTAADEDHKKYLSGFLEKHKITYDNIVFTEEKHKLDYDIFIDDSPINAKKIFDSGKHVLLYNQPWNQDTRPRKNRDAQITRVNSLDHAIHLLESRSFLQTLRPNV